MAWAATRRWRERGGKERMLQEGKWGGKEEGKKKERGIEYYFIRKKNKRSLGKP